MKADIAMTQFQSSYASDQSSTGAHIEGSLIQDVWNISNVSGGWQIQGLQVAVDRAEDLGVVVHDQDAVLVVSLHVDWVPHAEDDFLQAPQDRRSTAEIVAKLHKSIDDGQREKIPPTVASFLQWESEIFLLQLEIFSRKVK